MRLLFHIRNSAVIGLVAVAGAAWVTAASAETIAIIGTDEVAGALGPEFAALGHEVA